MQIDGAKRRLPVSFLVENQKTNEGEFIVIKNVFIFCLIVRFALSRQA